MVDAMNNIENDPKFWLKYELGHFIEIGNRFDQLRIPHEYKWAFFHLLVESINEVFQLSVYDPWNGYQNSAWNTILRSYSPHSTFEETIADLQENLRKMHEESRFAEILAERDRWHYEND